MYSIEQKAPRCKLATQLDWGLRLTEWLAQSPHKAQNLGLL
ncbi:hypothetical protein PL9631_940089 [Planktothrix paucivesiculata PCC 9631]|uniref:Uncharacterized protein n=1 Tax=Planktothrix paucivesiculata PCC 9631 TaxID=671071 RepID=A0A7Z9E5H8_9CYAN|nr:hypothetical protein PL9631_940089 [Planktothrix paucivesiculata PCC 9631]